MRVLAIDVGSSSVKAGVWDGAGFVARGREEFRTRFEGVRVEAPGEAVWRAVVRAARGVDAGAVDVVAFCTFSCGVVVTGERGELRVGAITHQDRRSVLEARELCARLGRKWLLARTGNLPYPGGIGSSTLAWLRRHSPEVFGAGHRVGQLSSFVGRRMTGEWVIDPSQAVFLGLWDIQRKAWNGRVCEAVGVSASLPRVVRADEVQGFLTRAAGRMLGVKEGTPVVGGFVDASAAVIQTPMGLGQLAHNSGSTDVLAMCVERAASLEGILSRPVGVGKVFPERWLAVRTIAAAGSALDWARRVMFSEMGEGAWRRVVERACAEFEVGDVTCLPAFAGERAAIEQSPGAMFGGVKLATGREEILAAIVQGLAMQSGFSYGALARLHKPARVVYEMGGAPGLREAMHRYWAGKHRFQKLEGDSLRGLVKLAEGL